jgi:hypothetical protein
MELAQAIKANLPPFNTKKGPEITFRDVIVVVTLAAAIIGGYAVLGQRVAVLEARQTSYVSKEYMDGRDSVHAEQFKQLGESIRELHDEVANSNKALQDHILREKGR